MRLPAEPGANGGADGPAQPGGVHGTLLPDSGGVPAYHVSILPSGPRGKGRARPGVTMLGDVPGQWGPRLATRGPAA